VPLHTQNPPNAMPLFPHVMDKSGGWNIVHIDKGITFTIGKSEGEEQEQTKGGGGTAPSV
jgi:hypothetical protein